MKKVDMSNCSYWLAFRRKIFSVCRRPSLSCEAEELARVAVEQMTARAHEMGMEHSELHLVFSCAIQRLQIYEHAYPDDPKVRFFWDGGEAMP